MNPESRTKQIEPYKYTHDRQIHYGIGVMGCFASVELYVDDVLIAQEQTAGNVSLGLEINDWVLKNGTHTFKVRYLPQIGKDSIEPYHIKDTRVTIDHWQYVENSVERPHSGKEDYQSVFFKVPTPPKAVPFWEFSGEFEVEDLPFSLTGWSESQDLSKMDREVLLTEVVDYYNHLRSLLNEGKVEELLSEEVQKNSEVAIATYDDPNWYYSQESRNDILKYKDGMLPVENFKMELYANGRLVRLIRNDEGTLKNAGVLIKEKERSWLITGGYLHKPKGSDTLRRIRK